MARRRGIDADHRKDLEAAGLLAVVRVAPRYDAARGPFGALARVVARRAMCELAAQQGSPVRLPKPDARRKPVPNVGRVAFDDPDGEHPFLGRTLPSPEDLLAQGQELAAASRDRL
jgi:hypothetical protein